jgi:hypothetical protein
LRSLNQLTSNKLIEGGKIAVMKLEEIEDLEDDDDVDDVDK